jgi:hypothetical protein
MVIPRAQLQLCLCFAVQQCRCDESEAESESDLYPLEKCVCNTEAHLLPVFRWTEWEREWYGTENHES